MVHALLSLVFCIPAALLGAPWPLLFWPAAFYLGREVAQAEYRYIEAHGGKRAACPAVLSRLRSAARGSPSATMAGATGTLRVLFARGLVGRGS